MQNLVIFQIGRDKVLHYQKGRGSYVNVPYRNRTLYGELAFDSDKGENELYIYQAPICIKANYTREDEFEKEMRRKAPTVTDGDIIEVMIINAEQTELKLVEKSQFKVKVLGDYSDIAKLEKIKTEKEG